MRVSMLKTIKEVLLDIFFPPVCLICEKILEKPIKERALCEKCFAKIKIHDTLFCAFCFARLPKNSKICHRDTPFVLAAASSYDDAIIQRLIWMLKYQKIRAAARPLAAVLLNYAASLNINFSKFKIIPIPLHPKRRKERGFNQTEVIGEKLSCAFGVVIDTKAIKRIKNNPPQAKMKDKKDRENNLKNSFSLINPASAEGQNIILIDDVYTTGATAKEAVEVLKNAGAKKIIMLVVAKA